MARIHPSADVADDAKIGQGSAVWHLAQVRERAVLGVNCVIGRGAYVGEGVVMGDNCKLQNHALVYEPAVLGDGVFVGPAVVFTNDHYPRSVTPEGRLKRGDDWEPVGVTVLEGASIGARAVCVAPVTIGRWALVAAGSVVVKDVPDFALVAGVPARRIRWVGHVGVPLEPEPSGPGSSGPESSRPEPSGPGSDSSRDPSGTRYWRCPRSGRRYVEAPGADGGEPTLSELTLTEVPQA